MSKEKTHSIITAGLTERHLLQKSICLHYLKLMSKHALKESFLGTGLKISYIPHNLDSLCGNLSDFAEKSGIDERRFKNVLFGKNIL